MAEVLESKPEAEVPVLPETLVAVPVPLSPRLTRYRKIALFAVPVLAVALSWGSAVGLHALMTAESPDVAVADRGPPSGARLYSQHCAQCHGERGDGRGLTPLDPPARHFGADPFKFGTTSNRLSPTDADLMRLVRNGIPGSAMPSFAQLSEEERRAIVGHVRLLTWENVFAELREPRRTRSSGDYDPLDVAARTDKQTAARPAAGGAGDVRRRDPGGAGAGPRGVRAELRPLPRARRAAATARRSRTKTPTAPWPGRAT